MKAKKGSIFDIIAWVVIALVVTLFLGMWLWAHQTLTDVMTHLPSVQVQNTTINMSLIGQQTFGQINTAEQKWLPIIAFIIIVCEALTILITNYYIKEHPLMFIPYVFVIAIAVVVSVYVSNVYQGFMYGNLPFSGYLLNMTMASYILIYLPIWTAVIGAFGAIFLMSRIIIDGDDR
jgi:hypothetical protein